MSGIDLVLTDIDGTLVDLNAHTPTAAVVQAMRDVQAAGVAVAAVTARPHEMSRDLFTELGFKGMSVFDGGASIRDVETGDLLWQNWLSVERLQMITRIMLPHATEIDFYPTYNIVPAKDARVDHIVEPAPYVWGFVDLAMLDNILTQLHELPGLNIQTHLPRPDRPDVLDLQITDSKSDKFHAVNALRELAHTPLERTLAIGDSGNDLPLFRAAGLKVAMGNAIPELKVLADYTVASVADDGFAEAMRRFVLS